METLFTTYNFMLDAKSMAPPFQALKCTVI